VTGIVAGAGIVTRVVAVYPPSTVVTVIVAVPARIAVRSPVLLTVTDDDDEDHVKAGFVAFGGITVAVSCVWVPRLSVMFLLSIVTPVTDIAAVIVAVIAAVNPPSMVVTVINTVPGAIPVTTPVFWAIQWHIAPVAHPHVQELAHPHAIAPLHVATPTVAIEGSEEDQVSPGFVAFVGSTVATILTFWPTTTLRDVLSTVMPVTGIDCAGTKSGVRISPATLPNPVTKSNPTAAVYPPLEPTVIS
jgi:hypothetical protein